MALDDERTGVILTTVGARPVIAAKKGATVELGIQGKRAFVSGSSSGIGKAIALELAREGCAVVVHGRDATRAEETAHEIEAMGATAVVSLGDLATDEGCETVAETALAALGVVDIVVNNAGVALLKDNPVWSEIPPQTWLDSYQINLMSALRMSLHFLPGIKESGWGRFINISTRSATTTPTMTEYGAAKAALNKLTADMAKDVGRYGATANAIAPGVIRTAAIEEWIAIQSKEIGCSPEEYERKYLSEILPQAVPHFGRPEDIAHMAAFLASRNAGYISGAVIRVCGGSATNVYL